MQKTSFLLLFFISLLYEVFPQNVGVGTNNPLNGKLVVRGTVGAVSALFGDNTTGVAIENSFPGIGLNTYFNAGRKFIFNGYGGLLGLDPLNGSMYMMSTSASGLANDPAAINYRLYIAGTTGNVAINSTQTSLGKFSVYDNANAGDSYGTIYSSTNPTNPAVLQAAIRGDMNPGNNNGVGVLGYHNSSGFGVVGYSLTGTGVYGLSSAAAGGTEAGVHGAGLSRGVSGENSNGTGIGVYGNGGRGIFGRTNSSTGIGVDCFDGGMGALALALRTNGKTQMNGDVAIVGTLSKSAGSFKIDHPLDPENKFLIHSFVESPDMMNVYNGNAETGIDGFAVVDLPAYFEAENIDFKYQLTIVGKEFAQAIVFEEIRKNSFVIKTDKPFIKVSWMVTGIRNDRYAQKNRIVPEVLKNDNEKGKYMIPSLYNQPAEKKITNLN